MAENKEHTLLKGESNYLGWQRLLKSDLIEKSCLLPEVAVKTATETLEEIQKKRALLPCVIALDNRIIDPTKENLAVRLVTKSIHMDVLNNIPCDVKTASALVDYCKTEFGSVDAYTRKQHLKKIRMKTNNPDPRTYFEEFGRALAQVVAAGASMTGDACLELLLEGLDQSFYRDLIRSVNKKRRIPTTDSGNALFLDTKEEIRMFYDDSPPIAKPAADNTAHLATLMHELASLKRLVSKQANMAGRLYEKKHCETCMAAGRTNAARSHNTPDHVDGYVYKSRPNTGNKSSSPYVYDSGASDHYFKDQPTIGYKRAHGQYVKTADGTNVPIVGSGDCIVGDLVLQNVHHTPSFTKNLISASKLSQSGHNATIDADGFLTIFKKGRTVARGEVKDGLVIVNNYYGDLPEEGDFPDPVDAALAAGNQSYKALAAGNQSYTYNDAHVQWGHCSKAMMESTAKSSNIALTRTLDPCYLCALTKSNQKPKKKSSSVRSHHPLEVTQIDLQGPLPVLAIDGTCSNLKLVDDFTGFITMKSIGDKSSETIANLIKVYKDRFELKTGCKMISLASDQGTEFDGAVLTLLEEWGMTKLKGVGYRHHLPPKAEKANQDVLKFGRVNLLQSMLPANLYVEAQQHAVYTLNRLVRVGKQQSPFELMFKKKPKLTHLIPFGTVCYVWVPIEKRSKLDNVREKARVIGYGDDGDLEEIVGYKVLFEKTGLISWSNDVIFNEECPFQPLPANTLATELSVDSIFADPDYKDNVEDEAVGLSSSDIDSSDSETDEDSDSGDLNPPDISMQSPIASRPVRGNRVNYQESSDSEDESSYSAHLTEYLQALNINSSEALLQRSSLPYSNPTPQTHTEAMASDEAPFWREAERVEIAAMKSMGTFGKAKLTPRGRRPVKSRWVYAKKFDENNNLIKFKARLVAKGFSQVYGKDYLETFSPVAMLKSIRTLAAIAAAKGMKIHHMDVATAFLNAPLTKIDGNDVHLELPAGCNELGLGDVVRVFRALYGFKQSPREWNQVLHQRLLDLGFSQCIADPCIYYKGTELYVGIFVDDLFIVGSNPSIINDFKTKMKERFKMTDLGLLTWYLGMHFTQTDEGIAIDQSQYIAQKLSTFNFSKWTVATPLLVNFQDLLDNDDGIAERNFPYRSAVGSLIHLMRSTRPDIAVAVSIVSRYLDRPTKVHCDMVRRIYQYLAQSQNVGLVYKTISKEPLTLVSYSDASYANSYDSRSISGYGILLCGTLVSWYSHTQPVVALSTAEAEYISITDTAKEIVWFKLFLKELGYEQSKVVLFEDNEAAIKITKNPQDHKRTKHIQVRYHYVRDQLREGVFKLVYVPTEHQLADLFTKGMYGPRLRFLMGQLGILPISPSQVSEGQLSMAT